MDNTDRTYQYFLTALRHVLKDQIPALDVALNADVSEPYISQIKTGKRQAGFNGQVKIANACGYEYLDFLLLGKQIANPEIPKDKKIGSEQSQECQNCISLETENTTLKEKIELLEGRYSASLKLSEALDELVDALKDRLRDHNIPITTTELSQDKNQDTDSKAASNH